MCPVRQKVGHMKTLLTRRQTAAHLGISTRTVARYERDGRIRAVRLTARSIRYDAADIDRLIEESTGNTKSE